MSAAPHRFRCRVHYEDTDLGGGVYHANYLKFIERARSDWVRRLGIDQRALRAQGVVFAVHRIEADFLAPARLDDEIEVETVIEAAGPVRLRLCQTALRLNEGAAPSVLFRARVVLVAMTVEGRPTRLPAALRRLTAAG